MGLCIYPLSFLRIPDIATLAIQFTVGVCVYIGGCMLFKIEAYQYLWNHAKPVLLRVLKREIKTEEND